MTQTRLFGEMNAENSAALTADARHLKPAINMLTVLVDECRLTLSDDGLRVAAADPANVGMIDLQIHADGVESYSAPDEDMQVGIPLRSLEKSLIHARTGKKQSDSVSININELSTVVEVEREYDQLEQSVTYGDELNTLDPDSVRQKPEVPDLDLLCEALVGAKTLKDVVEHIDHSADETRIESDWEDILMEGVGSGQTSRVAIDDAIQNGGVCDSIFSNDYLTGMTKALYDSKADTVELRVGERFPMKMTVKPDHGAFTATYMLAPRVQE